MRRSTLIVGGVVAAALIVGTGGGAYAAKQISGRDIQNGTVTGADVKDGSLHYRELSDGAAARLKGAKGETGAQGADGAAGERGAKGEVGDSLMADAYYAVAFYDVGNTNAGAIATVACKATTDTAISGGVQVTGIDGGANARNTPVSSSFPGRMMWADNPENTLGYDYPKTDRLDGWIVQFGGNAGAVSDKDPQKVKVWALCVPGMTIPVERTWTQSS